MYVICEIQVPTYISVSRLNAYFLFNNWLSGIIQFLIKRRMSTVVDISVLRVFSLETYIALQGSLEQKPAKYIHTLMKVMGVAVAMLAPASFLPLSFIWLMSAPSSGKLYLGPTTYVAYTS